MKKSGILLHLSSLPGNCGVGSLGVETDNFIKFLVKAKQSVWQILPINACKDNSPYFLTSAYGGNSIFIDLAALNKEGLLTDSEIGFPTKVGYDFEYALRNKTDLLYKACERFFDRGNLADFYDFCDANAYWLNDYATFMALKQANEGRPWNQWADKYAQKDKLALSAFCDDNSDTLDYYKFEQYVFYTQWAKFRAKLRINSILLFGDMPYGVCYDSVDVWSNRQEFVIDKKGRMTLSLGSRPDEVYPNGRNFATPLYNFKQMRKNGFAWFKKRIEYCVGLFDILRLDRFNYFDRTFAVPYGKQPRSGKVVKGGGLELLTQLKQCVPNATLIADDEDDELQFREEVKRLRERLDIDGVRVMQRGFDGNNRNIMLPHNYDSNCVGYLSTHNTPTTVGWYRSNPIVYKKMVTDYCHVPSDTPIEQVVWQMTEELFASQANTVIVPMQDLNALSNNSRMNDPQQPNGGWNYMANNSEFSASLAKRLALLTDKTGRNEQL